MDIHPQSDWLGFVRLWRPGSRKEAARSYGGAACALVSALSILTAAASATSCTSPPRAVGHDVIVWRNLGSWSGRGNAQTGSFGSDTGALRVRWQTSNEPRKDAGRFRITLRSSVSGRTLTVAADQQGAGTGESMAAETSPVVYAFVESTDIDWSFTVDEGLLGTRNDSSRAAR